MICKFCGVQSDIMSSNNSFMRGVRSIFHPGKESAGSLDIWGSLKIYYSIAIISTILTAIAIGIMYALGVYSRLGGGLHVFGIASVFSSSAPIISILSAAITIFIIVPISIFAMAIIYQLIGKNFLNAWRGTYEKTFAAAMFSVLPVTLFYWAISIPVLGLVFAFVFGIWDFVVLTIALASQHKIERTKSIIIVLVGAIFSIIIAMLVFSFFTAESFAAVLPSIPSTTVISPGNASIIPVGSAIP